MDFEKAKSSYRQNAVVQKQMASKLVSFLIEKQNKYFENIFEIGAGTGFLTDEIRKNLEYKKLILNDITDNFTNFEPDKYIKGDINKIEMPSNIDLIISNAAFQWVEDYELLFKRLNCTVKKEGVVCFSSFGKNNFRQIKDITGIGLSYPVLDEFIKNADFKILYFEEELKTLYFNDVKKLLEHIKLTGVKTQNKVWTKKDFACFNSKYLKNYKDSLGFELTYHPIFYILAPI